MIAFCDVTLCIPVKLRDVSEVLTAFINRVIKYSTSETSLNFYEITQSKMPEDRYLYIHRRVNLNSFVSRKLEIKRFHHNYSSGRVLLKLSKDQVNWKFIPYALFSYFCLFLNFTLIISTSKSCLIVAALQNRTFYVVASLINNWADMHHTQIW
jgi:hypothetical protein